MLTPGMEGRNFAKKLGTKSYKTLFFLISASSGFMHREEPPDPPTM
jgi:hypothetical protein